MKTNMYIIDDYIECVDSYVGWRGLELNEGDTIEECAQYVMNWCTINNHDLSTIPLPALERIIKMYYHSAEEEF